MGTLIRHKGIDTVTVAEMFAGAGGSGDGIRRVPGTELIFGANHFEPAKWTYMENHQGVDFWLGDVQKPDAIEKFPYSTFFWASPACPRFSTARGDKRWFDKENQMALWDLDDMTEDDKAGVRSRALMEEVVVYLRYCQEKHGRPVLGFGVENVIQARLWVHWDRWVQELRKLGYIIQVHAINAMHAQGRTTSLTPQSRDRLMVSGIHESVRRTPNYAKWFDPYAWCPKHEGWIQARQAWKKPGQDMGAYGKHGQYLYVCPLPSCGNQVIEPPALPAAATIDWTDLGTPIGSRKKTKEKPEGMAPKTIDRVRAGVIKHWITPFLSPAGGTWNDDPTSVIDPARTLTTRESQALVVPCEGREGKMARPVSDPKRTSTTRLEDAVAFPPDSFLSLFRSDRVRTFDPSKDPTATLVAGGSNHALGSKPEMTPLVFPMRGGGDTLKSRPAFENPAHCVTASGFYHGLGVHPDWMPPSFVMRNNGSRGDGKEHCIGTGEPARTITSTGHQSLARVPEGLRSLLMAYYGNGGTTRTTEPVGTLPTRDRWALMATSGEITPDAIDVSSIKFRMLKLRELQRAQSFDDDYRFIANSQRHKVKLIGNAVPPPMAEILACAVIEAILGVEFDRFAHDYALIS
ncbi:DNA cytosine methyltransferase [Nonomuraea sp. NPDC052129]|uniref:DNA cytosine methyltransferase n=1 Tax=Nonomuraea sp. NPDC052129 TaxID=3154651 RepID=UPI00342AC91F